MQARLNGSACSLIPNPKHISIVKLIILYTYEIS